MFRPVALAEQLDAVADDPVRVLIVGAGVAGTSLGGLLRRDGLHPVLLERGSPDADQGYMLALMPLVDPVIDTLGVRDAYRARSTELSTYAMRDRHGRPLGEYSMTELLARFGDYRGIDRGSLLEVLSGDGLPVTYGASLTSIQHHPETTLTTLEGPDGPTEAEFDLVVAADGLNSHTRELVLGDVPGTDTGWGGWIAWTGPGQPADRGEEVWGAGFLVAAYPVNGDTGVIVGGPRDATRVGPERFVEQVRSRLKHSDGVIGAALDAVATEQDPYYWALRDRRSPRWSEGRVVLLGDAAAGFLPTAGIGAAMAMESAGVLADRLRGRSREEVPAVLTAYEHDQRPRVEAAQATSRTLARLMFREGHVTAALRDAVSRYVPISVALRPVVRLLQEGPPGSATGAGSSPGPPEHPAE